MEPKSAIAPSFAQLRPLKPPSTPGFPVYAGLAEKLAAVKRHPDDTAAHVLATCAGYAYAEEQTVAMMMARLGLERNRCLRVFMSVDAMFISSTAYLVQSADGSVVVLAYRGTEPANFINWLTDADVNPEPVRIPFPGAGGDFEVHGGFYRNVLATRVEVIEALQRALSGQSIVPGGGPVHGPLQALYVTGHSLGGAMAALMGVMLVTEPAYAPIADTLRAVYTFGQPMIGEPRLARACAAHSFLGTHVVRYVYRHDVVAELPPTASGDFAHFGTELRYSDSGWKRSATATRQMSNLLEIPGAVAAFAAHQLRWLRKLPFQHSIYDHMPRHYISTLKPPQVISEFGD
jgi:Lipase (class 3)